jgi:signal transduction histidine kinase
MNGERAMSKTARICITDDDPVSREILGELLEVEKYEIFFAQNGFELLAHLDKWSPDVILLDVMMPGLDGYAVCQRLKANERWRHIPVILITALDQREELIRGLNAGADEFLSKPIGGSQLRARVRSMLRIKKQYDELQKTLQLREELANMVVHDMRIPLSLAMLYSELMIRRATLAEKDLQAIHTIRAQILQLDSLINDVLVAAKMEQGALLLNPSTIDLHELLSTMVHTYLPLAQATGIKLQLQMPPNLPSPSFDLNLFKRVLDNLLSNALKYSPPQSSVTVRVVPQPKPDSDKATDSSVMIQVIDEGLGIPQEHHEEVFDKYRIVALRQEGITQIGLGLAFCKLVVTAHGGKIYVRNNKPTGAIFTIEI